jgi:hypothetical protein
MADWRKKYREATAKNYDSDTINIAFHWDGESKAEIHSARKKEGEKFIEQNITKRSHKIRLIKIGTTDIYRPPAPIAT